VITPIDETFFFHVREMLVEGSQREKPTAETYLLKAGRVFGCDKVAHKIHKLALVSDNIIPSIG